MPRWQHSSWEFTVAQSHVSLSEVSQQTLPAYVRVTTVISSLVLLSLPLEDRKLSNLSGPVVVASIPKAQDMRHGEPLFLSLRILETEMLLQ